MRKALMIAGMLAFAGPALWAGDKIKTVAIKTTINCDHCKMCPSCGARLEKSLYDQKGIKRVDVDDQHKTIKVVYHSEKITLETIKNTIAASGYDADEVKAPAEALAKLDACCRGAE
ncbi:cation transporter [Taibaiella chishuiensis]|nr:cation transporter [Taibaiella chishuiensis]